MKTRLLISLLFLSFALILFSCVKEGPAGISGLDGVNGSDGTDGVNGGLSCTVCHGGDVLIQKKIQYAYSGHKAGANAAYAGGRASCAKCHSSEGFIEFQDTGEIGADISNPNAFTCKTCHVIHHEFTIDDYALRGDGPEALNFDPDISLDYGDGSNVCLNCHQTRTPEPGMSDPSAATFRITSTHYGPHHGTQANVFEGIGFAEIDGPIVYAAAASSKHRTQGTCLTCHMGEYTNGQGGHTWKPSQAACNSCHTFSSESYNYFGKQDDIKGKLDELRELLINKGLLQWIEEDQAYEPIIGTYDLVYVQAYFNWVGLEDDGSLGVHNYFYVNALLTNSIAALK